MPEDTIHGPKGKIGIMTYHRADNYGSVLQAYALQRILRDELDFQAQIIPFTSEAQKSLYTVFLKTNSWKDALKNMYIACFLQYKRAKVSKSFETFRKEFLDMEKRAEIYDFSSFDESVYQAVICGSDQIWNIHIDDFQDAYMLNFLATVPKISYAASMGGLDLHMTVSEKQHIQGMLTGFRAISVRENIAKKMLCQVGLKDISVNIDPVFLLSANTWKSIASPRLIAEEYIFFYSVDYNDDSIHIAQDIGKYFKLPVIYMNTGWKSYFIFKKGLKVSRFTGVPDFLSLILHAKYVLSGSFHGTAFSLIFNKPFFRIQKRSGSGLLNDDRVKTLSELLDVYDREVSINDFKDRIPEIDQIDYDHINIRIVEEKERAYSFLRKNLQKY